MAWVFFGTQITYGSLLLGAVPVILGLGWWQGFTAIVVGTLLGSLAVAGMALLGPRTGTDGTVSSGAFFGIRGRYVGSFITQVIDLGYFALVLWISAPPLLQAGHRLFGWPTTGTTLNVTLVLIALATLACAILGHATIVAYEKFTAIASLVCLLLLTYFTVTHWHPPATPPKLALGGFWATWMLATTAQISNAISYAPFAGDYARYMPGRTPPRRLFGWSLLGMVAGCIVALTCGEIIALGVSDAGISTSTMMDNLPAALLIPVALIGLVGNLTNGAMVAYNGTLDLHAILWRMRRPQVGLIFGAIGLVVGYVGLVLFNLTDSILALCSVVTVLVTPWIMINIIGYRQHGGRLIRVPCRLSARARSAAPIGMGMASTAAQCSPGCSASASACSSPIPASSPGPLRISPPASISALSALLWSRPPSTSRSAASAPQATAADGWCLCGLAMTC